jgi:hypothetical protein
MLGRATIISLLILTLCTVSLPSRSEPKPKTSGKITSTSTAQGLTTSTTQVRSPDGKSIVWNLTGQYINVAGRILKLRATTVHPFDPQIMRDPWCPGCAINPGARANSGESAESMGDPESMNDYENSNSEMSGSDGTVMVATALEYNEDTSRSMFYVTLNGVQFSIDLNAHQEVVPVSEEDRAKVGQWLETEDGRLVRQAGIALIQQGANEPENEALLTYWLVAMMVGDDSSAQAALRLTNKRKPSPRSHHGSIRPESRLVEPFATGPCLGNSLPNGKTLVAASLAPVQCQGCCGVNCYCIIDWFGRPMYSTPCAQHDTCARNYGGGWGGRLHPACAGYGYAAIQSVVIFRVSRRR